MRKKAENAERSGKNVDFFPDYFALPSRVRGGINCGMWDAGGGSGIARTCVIKSGMCRFPVPDSTGETTIYRWLLLLIFVWPPFIGHLSAIYRLFIGDLPDVYRA
jgi:hypothetical protein